jgi:hypothetical protein
MIEKFFISVLHIDYFLINRRYHRNTFLQKDPQLSLFYLGRFFTCNYIYHMEALEIVLDVVCPVHRLFRDQIFSTSTLIFLRYRNTIHPGTTSPGL